MSAVERAVELIGSQAAMARACGQKPQAVTRWLKQGRVPPKHAPTIEAAVDGRVSRRELCPDFPWDTAEQPVPALNGHG